MSANEDTLNQKMPTCHYFMMKVQRMFENEKKWKSMEPTGATLIGKFSNINGRREDQFINRLHEINVNLSPIEYNIKVWELIEDFKGKYQSREVSSKLEKLEHHLTPKGDEPADEWKYPLDHADIMQGKYGDYKSLGLS